MFESTQNCPAEFQPALNELLECHGDNLVAVLGYGSNFGGYCKNTKDSIWDTIVVVKNTKKFHEINISARPKDYWRLLRNPELQAKLNSWGMNYIQSEGGDGTQFKYPVVGLSDFEADCKESKWGNYVAGRLQKNFKIIHSSKYKNSLSRLEKAVEIARTRGALDGLLTLGAGDFNFEDFLESVVKLSYRSDVRLEDPNKIKKIVRATKEELTKIYRPIFEKLISQLSSIKKQGDDSFVSEIPKSIRTKTFLQLVDMKPMTAVRNYIKNPLSNTKSIPYAWAKMQKWKEGRENKTN